MELTLVITKYTVLLLVILYGASGICKKKGVIVNKTAIFKPIPQHHQGTNLSLKYDSKGLQPLFNLANSFMDTLQPKYFGVVFKDEKLDKFKEWKWVLKKYEISIAICIGVGLLFMIFMPIVGWCFCCCRCCGKCGGDMKQSEKKSQQHCKVAFMIFLLFVFTIMMLCGSLFMFVTNARIHTATNNTLKVYDESVNEASKLADNLVKDIDVLAKDQVSCITDLLKEKLTGENIKVEIGNPLKKQVKKKFDPVFKIGMDISQRVDDISKKLEEVVKGKNKSKVIFDKLENKLISVKNKLETAKTDCNKNASLTTICNELKAIKLETKMNFASLPNIDSYSQDMKNVQSKDIGGNIRKAKKIVDDIPETVVKKSNSSVQEVVNFINKLENDIKNKGEDASGKLKKQVTKIKDSLKKNNQVYNAFKNDNVGKFERIRWKVYVALSALMAFIVFILLCGIACGSCGYSKEYMPTERSTTSNCGGNFLMAAVGLMFIFSFILMLFCVLWFTVGVHTHLVCRELKGGDLIDTVMKMVNSSSETTNLPDISVKDILTNCRKNVGIFQATPYIEKAFNVSEKLDMKQMEGVRSKINGKFKFDLNDQKVLSGGNKDALAELSKLGNQNINFTKFNEILNTDITSQNLTEIYEKLMKMASKLSSNPLAGKIIEIANDTKDANNIMLPMVSDINGLKITLDKLNTSVFGIDKKGAHLLTELEKTEAFVQNDTVQIIKNEVKYFANKLFNYTNDGISHILKQVKENLGQCKPIANIYDGVVNTFLCDNLIQNSNGFWLALGWCLLFFIPSIILSVKLAKYFRRMDYTAGMDTIVVDHPPYNDKLPPHSNKGPYSTPGYSHDMRPPPPYTSTQHSNPGYQHV